ncbi:MAG: ABC transporter substrate-binding protein [Acidobacteria bacterium]|nr:ABC transporter substrate-binding protein [Acidobacteriota bacterium]
MRAETRSVLSLSLGVILLTALAGCQEDTEPIKIGISAWAGVEPAELAFRAGHYERRGVAVEMVRFSAYTDSIEAFREGRVDVDMQTFDDAIRLAAGGKKMKVVLFTDHSYGGDGIVARKDISSVDDLRGKTVGVETGTVGHFSLLKALEKSGLREQDITIISIPAWEIKEAFVAGEIDAGVTWEPYLTSSAEEGDGNVIITSRSYPNQIVTTMVVSDELIATRRPAVQSIVAAYFDAVKHIEERPAEAYAMMAAAEGISPEDFGHHVEGLRYLDLMANKSAFDPARDGELYSRGRSLSAFLASKGVIDSEPDIDHLLLGAFVQDLR